MKKTHLVSALGMAMVLAAMGASQGFALEMNNYNDSEIFLSEVSRSAELEKVMSDARIAREIARQNPSETYPGLVKYIDGLLEIAESGNIQNESELIAALDDAAFATPLLLGVKVAQTSGEMVKSTETTAVQALAEVNESSAADSGVILANATIAEVPVSAVLQTEVKVADDSEKILEGATSYDNENKEVSDGEGVVEVPNTRENEVGRKAGMGELIIAGAAVMLATVGGAVLVIKNKKNN